MAAAGPSVFLLMVNGQVESAQVSGRGPRGAAPVPPGPSLAGGSQRVRGLVRGRANPPPHVRYGNRPGGLSEAEATVGRARVESRAGASTPRDPRGSVRSEAPRPRLSGPQARVGREVICLI